ncbi:IS3 family transposase [Shigella boydii]|uniref:IS3 family transposase n=1 Tax=Shigella boydii TaxID=621 RepID=UPI0028786A41|nr:IS3 family transposase [Shigella boydii]MDS1480713.1 IS3 family transposase [Shigella boydii]MDS1488114.1 IS3 family transposase [Shigella boydii]
MTKNTRFSPEVRQRAVRMVLESQGEYDSQWATICSIAPKIGCTPETLRVWVRQHERDTGGGDGGEGIRVARCTVARLMAVMGLAGVLRGKKVRTTISRKAVAAGDRVNRQFVAERPDQLWVADFTYVSTWQGFVYVAFIIDVFAGYIVGWRVSSSMETTFVLDALEQALWARRPSGTVHHSDKGSQYVSLAYTQRLKEAGLLASTGSTGDSYDNAMAESINGLYKAEVIHRKSWKNRAEVELATLTWGDWYNNRRLLERLGHTPPAEAEKAYYASIGNDDLAA